MNRTQVGTLLDYVNGLDPLWSNSEERSLAWFDLFQKEAPGMDYAWAEKAVARHYAVPERGTLVPGGLVAAWHDHQRARMDNDAAEAVSDAHCGRAGCACTHTGVCYKGWIDSPDGPTAPCRVCRASLAEVLDEIPPLGERSAADHAKIRNRHRAA